MLRPVTISTTGPSTASTCGSAASAAAAEASTLMPGRAERPDRDGQLALVDAQHPLGGPRQHVDRVGDRHADGQAVGDGGKRIRLDEPARLPALRHDRRGRRDDADPQGRRRALGEAQADPA